MGKKSDGSESNVELPFLQQIAFEVGVEFKVRPREVYDNWDYNEVMSYWITIREEKYQELLSQLDKKEKNKYPKKLFVREIKEEKEENYEDLLKEIDEISKLKL